ncbi:MAG: hypothetical protein P4L42_10655 [Desulfocapsaceae bacterium]|nr:hypothetical protein [Desulfocapsaceae bacterium]
MALPTQQPGDKLKKAIRTFSELLEKHPEKSRMSILHEVEIRFDLSPKECEFLNSHFDKGQ